jgi:hypothetical protein
MYVREAALVASCSRWVAACWWIGAPASPAGARTIHGRYSVERIELRPMRAMLREACTFGTGWILGVSLHLDRRVPSAASAR